MLNKANMNQHTPIYIYIYIGNVFVISLAFLKMLGWHYSPDTYCVIADLSGQPIWHIQNGRFVFGLLFALSNLVGLSVGMHTGLYTLVFITVSAYCAARITYALCSSLSVTNVLRIVLCNLAVLIGFVNICVWEWYYFPECMMMYAIAILCATEAGLIWKHREYSLIWRSVCSFFLLFLSINSYQACLSWYVAISFFIILLSKWFRIRFEEIRICMLVLGIGAINSIMNQTIVNVLSNIGIIPTATRKATLLGNTLLHNVYEILKNQEYIWLKGYELLPHCFVIAAFVCSIVLFALAVWRLEKIKGCIAVFVSVAVSIALVFLPHLVSNDIWITPRTVTGIFVCIALMLSGCILLGDRYIRCVASMVVLMVLCVNSQAVHNLGEDNLLSNKLDREEGKAILEAIEQYEAEAGIAVNNICIIEDQAVTWKYPQVELMAMDINKRQTAVDWAIPSFLKVLSGRTFNVVQSTKVVEERFIQDRDWNHFVPDEQLVFDRDTLYYIIY